MKYLDILQCPNTGESLSEENDLKSYLDAEEVENIPFDSFQKVLVNDSKTWAYPVVNDIIVLLPQRAIPLTADAKAESFSFNSDRVFRYYNEISYIEHEDSIIYSDSGKWVDYREVSIDYIKRSFRRAAKYLDGKGTFYLDVASGPIGLKEYIDLSKDYDVRICIDLSFNALVQAKRNYHREGLFICGDITNIPLRENVCDAVLSQHTLYHVPKEKQHFAVNELYRVTKPGGKVAIVYNWFYYSLIMNIALFPVQIYRVARYYLSLSLVRFFPEKPRLYFHVYPPSWFKQFDFAEHIEMFSWRLTNKYFLQIYAHSWLGGKKFLNWLGDMEDKHAKKLGKLGAYPIIVINKPK